MSNPSELNAQARRRWDRANLRLIGRWLWGLIVAFYMVILLIGLPSQIQQYNTFSGVALRLDANTWSHAGLQAALVALGLSNYFLTLYRTSFALLNTLFFVALGVLIFVRRADERMGWFTSLFLVTFGLVSNNSFAALGQAYPAMVGWLNFMVGLPWVMFYLFFYIYPNGQFVPRWTAIWAVALLGLIAIASFAPDIFNSGLFFVILAPAFGFAVFAQVYRYTRISDSMQRAQVKWVMYAIAGVTILNVGRSLLPVVFPVLAGESPSRLAYQLVLIAFTLVFGMMLPLALTVAILQYRLWDIDFLIRRTLQYTLLSGVLALTYFGLVVVLQNIFSAVSGQSSPAVLVLSTLAIAALFLPLRRRVQGAIDRRFYRKKYNAAKVIADFAATCRVETDLDNLTARLVQVVEETMQPESVSLWLIKDRRTDHRLTGEPVNRLPVDK